MRRGPAGTNVQRARGTRFASKTPHSRSIEIVWKLPPPPPPPLLPLPPPLFALTVSIAELVTLPRSALVHVRVYVWVPAVFEVTVWVPPAPCAPAQPPEAVQPVMLIADHV